MHDFFCSDWKGPTKCGMSPATGIFAPCITFKIDRPKCLAPAPTLGAFRMPKERGNCHFWRWMRLRPRGTPLNSLALTKSLMEHQSVGHNPFQKHASHKNGNYGTWSRCSLHESNGMSTATYSMELHTSSQSSELRAQVGHQELLFKYLVL